MYFSIFQKMFIVPLLSIILFGGFLTYSYIENSKSAKKLEIAEREALPLLEITNENIFLLKQINTNFQDAVSASETEWLNSSDTLKDKIVKNFEILKKDLNKTTDLKVTLNHFLEYYKNAKNVAKLMIEEKFNEKTSNLIDEMNKKQQLTVKNFEMINSLYHDYFTTILKDSHSGLENLLITAIKLGVFIIILMVLIAIFIFYPILKSLREVTNSLKNIAKGKPNFSKRLKKRSFDEIGEIVDSFNSFARKLEVDYKTLDEQKKIAEEAKQKAIKATESKSQFLANMSHEIRTPMNSIIGISYLLSQTELNLQQKDYIKKIDNSAKSLLNIINDILDFSKIEAGKLTIEKTLFDLYKTIDSVIELIEFKAHEKNLELIVSFESDINREFYGDSLRLSQILLNLLSNAIKFTDSGKIELYISKVKDNRYKFEVKDSGIGLSKEVQSKLFKSFSQADSTTTRKYGGTGLGLAISKELVEMMGGEIWVESSEGVGSSFIFEIELKEAFVTTDKSYNRELNSNFKDNISNLEAKILVVEDNVLNQEVILGLLDNSEISIDIANNGKEAIEKFKSNRYNLILMDIQMPIMDGYEATKIIRTIDNKIPIVALSANVTKEGINKTKEIGMNAYLIKPIEVELFYNTLVKYINIKPIDIKSDSSNIPKLNSIDTKLALTYMGGNEELYLKVLSDFAKEYRYIDFDKLSEDEIKRVIHTIKGLSGNIGATKLHKVTEELDKRENLDLLALFSSELKVVIDEIVKNIKPKVNEIKRKEISITKKNQLFKELKEAISTKRPKLYLPILSEIDKYNLSANDKEAFEKIKELIDGYKFKEAINLLES